MRMARLPKGKRFKQKGEKKPFGLFSSCELQRAEGANPLLVTYTSRRPAKTLGGE